MNERAIVEDKEAKVRIKTKTVVSKNLDSKTLKKERPKEYEDCRTPRKYFEAKKLKEKYPKIYQMYMRTTESKTISIERIVPELEEL